MLSRKSAALPGPLFYFLFYLFPATAWIFAENFSLVQALAFQASIFFVAVFLPFLRIRKLQATELGPLSASLIGLFLFSYCPSHLILLKSADPSGAFIVLVFLFAWISDSMAYFSGVMFGKHPAGVPLSPKKTWEGFFIGGVLSVAVMAWIMIESPSLSIFGLTIVFSPAILVEQGMGILIVIAVIFVVFVAISDLWESFFKRFSGVKNSSSLLPGHGGILDALDSSFVTSFAMCYVYLILRL